MKDFSEAELGWERIDALVHRDRIAHCLVCDRCEHREETEFWLALLGWTGDAFLIEAYPELYGYENA